MLTKRAFMVAPGRMELREVELEEPKQGELLIKVSVCGLCTWELNHYHGRIGEPPMSLGHEFAGTVIAIGDGTSGFAIGDAVAGLPTALEGFSEYMLVKSDDCEKIAPHIQPEQALGEPLKCIVTVLRAATPEAGDFGVVVGAGPMGLWAIQALSGHLLGGLIAVDVDADKLKLAASFGASHTINPLEQNAEEAIREITRGHMADFVIEGTGNPKVINDGIRMLRKGRGRLVLMSSYKTSADGLDVVEMGERAVEIRVASPGYSLNGRDDFRRAIHLLNTGVFRPEAVISHKFRLDQIQEAFHSLDQRPPGYLKGVVIPHS